MKIKTLVLTILMITIVLGVSDPSEAYDISTTATVQMDDMEPEINSSSLTITLDDDRDYIIPYGFTGESIGFTVDVTDNNGANDLTEVILFISNDINIDNNDIKLTLTHKREDVNSIKATFENTWIIPSEIGRKYIVITASDSTGLSSYINAGEIFLNPLLGFEIKDGSGNSLTSIIFPSSFAGATDVAFDMNAIQIINTDPNNVGMKIRVSIRGTELISDSNIIPVSNVKIDDMSLSQSLIVIDDAIDAEIPSKHNFYIDYPVGIQPGTYHGTIKIEIGAMLS
ncbi:MAG: hypothetical protein KAJ93_04345 [Methanosarcinales archaeon]|nr:hypothetical protein [Methanosarcinales archaeon]